MLKLLEEGGVKFYSFVGVPSKKMPVFFNPAKEFDRSLSLEIAKLLGVKSFLDLLAGSGIRAIRFAKEGISVVMNDANPQAYKLMQKNCKLNGVEAKIYNEDANKLCCSISEKFDMVDVDPFGSPMKFMFNAIRCVKFGGILSVTATDTGTLCGRYARRCYLRYFARVRLTPFMHELGIRVLAYAVIREGLIRNVYLRPIFAHATRHYYRVYFKKEKIRKPELGSIDDEKLEVGEIWEFYNTPLYIGNLWDEALASKLRFGKFSEIIKEEARIGVPYHVNLSWLASKLKISEPKRDKVIETLREAGFKASRTHFNGKGIRTDAPLEELKKLLR